MRPYLTRFRPKHTPHFFTDVLVIGGGIAGIRAALAVPPDLSVLIVTKDIIQQSNSAYAQGGIAGVLSAEDRFENHIDDTLRAGAGLCDRPVVEMVVREAPGQINDLIRWGTSFDLEDGHLALTREGGHSHRRIVHALGDATGSEVMRALIARIQQAENVELWEKTFTVDLLTHEGCCAGAVVSRPRRNRLLVWAKQTILAAGGVGMVYRETTNPPVATGDGMAAAYRAGAELRDMEFMQFHPTVLYVAGSSRFLISEAVRGEGAYLRDKTGARFMLEEDPRAELAPRDVVAQAIVRCMERTQHPNVYLDLSHVDAALVRHRFPGIAKVCQGFGIDITRDPIPVRPGAHYMIGGVTVDLAGRTTLPGLWAAGEVTSSGLHGANRLASNSLLEGLVYGAACAKGAAEEAARMPDHFAVPPLEARFEPERDGQLDVADITNSLRSLMVRKMGIVRMREALESAEHDVAFWCRYVLGREFATRAGWELQNLLTVARLMIHAAKQREESRGVHFRSDFAQRDDSRWARHLACPPAAELFGYN
ncbi:L-aspartate oxidase [Planctomycetaceae bacterium SCGC AG-212-D15]|nr:L-aspartate oxidase [Planctomycetaceae bacterium SCGC AG-212-D15]